MKIGLLTFGFDTLILGDMHPSFRPMQPYLTRMYQVLFRAPQSKSGKATKPSALNFMKIMLDAMKDPLIQTAFFGLSPVLPSPQSPMKIACDHDLKELEKSSASPTIAHSRPASPTKPSPPSPSLFRPTEQLKWVAEDDLYVNYEMEPKRRALAHVATPRGVEEEQEGGVEQRSDQAHRRLAYYPPRSKGRRTRNALVTSAPVTFPA